MVPVALPAATPEARFPSPHKVAARRRAGRMRAIQFAAAQPGLLGSLGGGAPALKQREVNGVANARRWWGGISDPVANVPGTRKMGYHGLRYDALN